MCKLNVLNERLLDLGLFILVLCIIIQIVYKSCIFNCTCGYWCTAVTRPSTAAYSRSPLLAVFQGHVATFPPPPVYWIVHCLMVHYTAPHSLRVHCLALYFTAMCCTSLQEIQTAWTAVIFGLLLSFCKHGGVMQQIRRGMSE